MHVCRAIELVDIPTKLLSSFRLQIFLEAVFFVLTLRFGKVSFQTLQALSEPTNIPVFLHF